MSGTWSNFQFILLKHITLICQHDKLPLVYLFISLILSLVYLKKCYQPQIFTVYLASSGITSSFQCDHTTMTSSRRHFVYVIIHIFITIIINCPNLIHITSGHWSTYDNPCPRVHHDAHVRARQNSKMLKITYHMIIGLSA